MVVALWLAIMFFYISFRPFQMAKYSITELVFVLLAYAAILLDVLAGYLLLFPKYFSNSFRRMVAKKKGRITLAGLVTLTIGIGFFCFKVVCGFYEFTLPHLSNGLMALGAFSAFPMVLITWLDREVATPLTEEKVLVSISEKHGNIDLGLVLFIYSDRNYVVWNCKHDGQLVEFRVRETLASVKQRLEVYQNVKQCHRAYLVNTDFIASVTKSGRSARIELIGLTTHLPLSRGHADGFQEFLT